MVQYAFNPNKPMAGFDELSQEFRDNQSTLFNGDCAPLRARAQTPPNMTVAVARVDVEGFWRQVWVSLLLPLNYAGGNSPNIVAPSSFPRIALLTIDLNGTLAWTYGAEAASPAPPNAPAAKIPICWVYQRTTMTKIVNHEDSGSYPNDGYIYRDVRPFLTLSGVGGDTDEFVDGAVTESAEYLNNTEASVDNTETEIGTLTITTKTANDKVLVWARCGITLNPGIDDGMGNPTRAGSIIVRLRRTSLGGTVLGEVTGSECMTYLSLYGLAFTLTFEPFLVSIPARDAPGSAGNITYKLSAQTKDPVYGGSGYNGKVNYTRIVALRESK